MAVAKTATEATTLTRGTEKRHHGRRLARNVDTGTVAATVATRRVIPRSCLPRQIAPSAPPEHGSDQIQRQLEQDPSVEERLDQAVDVVRGLVVVEQSPQTLAGRLLGVAI